MSDYRRYPPEVPRWFLWLAVVLIGAWLGYLLAVLL